MPAVVSRRSFLRATLPLGTTGQAAAICWARFAPRNTAHLYQRPS